MSYFDALDHFVYMVYKHPVILVVMFYKMIIMLGGMIYNLNLSYSHVLNHDVIIYSTTYDCIIVMLNYLYVIVFI